MITQAEPTTDEILDAVTAILGAIATRTNICPEDGCLLIGPGACPACELRKPRRCGCGWLLKWQEADDCWVCLRHARIAAQRACGCGVLIRTAADRCSRCRRHPVESVDVERPFRWVSRGGIQRPVFYEVA